MPKVMNSKTRLAGMLVIAWLLFVIPLAGFQKTRSVVGTVTGFKVESAEIEIKPDSGEAVRAKIGDGAVAQKIAPGEMDLKNAQPIKITDVVAGDRVLATLDAATNELRRIVVMSAGDIAKRNAADRADWAKRGVSGIVVAKKDNEITVRIKTLQGELQATVTAGEKTSFKRYAPDSVKFADAKASKLAEVGIGDELRARGQKSADGLKVAAEEVVFGTFETRAATVTAIDAAAREITAKDLTNNKTFVIKLAADSQLKSMAALAAALSGRGGAPAASTNGAAGAGRGAPAAGAGTPPAAAAKAPPAPAQAQAAAARAMAQMSIAQLLEAMPAAKFEEMKPGETIVVSSTKGAAKDRVTAITLVSKADMLIQIVEAQAKATYMTLAASGMGGTGSGGVQIPGMQ